MFSLLSIINMSFMVFSIYLITRSWGFVGILLIIECLWILLYCLFLLIAQYIDELSFYMAAVTLLVISAVELVMGSLVFIVYFEMTSAAGVHARKHKVARVLVASCTTRSVARAVWDRRF